MAEEALASLGALPRTRTRLITWPPRLRALSNIAFTSGSVEFSCTAGTRATGPSAQAGIANAATSAAAIVPTAETGSDSLVGLFIAILHLSVRDSCASGTQAAQSLLSADQLQHGQELRAKVYPKAEWRAVRMSVSDPKRTFAEGWPRVTA